MRAREYSSIRTSSAGEPTSEGFAGCEDARQSIFLLRESSMESFREDGSSTPSSPRKLNLHNNEIVSCCTGSWGPGNVQDCMKKIDEKNISKCTCPLSRRP